MHHVIRGVLAVGMMALLVGCEHGPSGKYTAQGGMASIEFKDGKAILSDPSGQSETDDYKVEGNTITVKSKSGDMKFTIMQDGSLEGMLGTFKKAAS